MSGTVPTRNDGTKNGERSSQSDECDSGTGGQEKVPSLS